MLETKHNFSKDAAIVLRRLTINSDLSLYLPTNIIMGKYNADEDIFSDISGQNYFEYKENIIQTDSNYCYLNAFTDIEIIEIFGDGTFDYNKALKNYYNSYKDNIYLAYTGSDLTFGNNDFIWNCYNVKSIFKNEQSFRENSNLDDLLQNLISIRNALTSLDLQVEDGTNKIRNTLEPFIGPFVDIWNIVCYENEKYQRDTINHNQQKELKTSNKAKEICQNIKNTVIGQDEHIEKIVYEILRLEQIKQYSKDKNSAILLTGASGVGKTKIITMLGEVLDRKVFIIDSTQLTIPGYVGMSIEDFLGQLYYEVNKDINKVEESIIVFDEIDKKGSKRNDDVSGKGVLNTILKFIDGTSYKLKDGKIIKTDKMTVIFSGAFDNVYQYNKKEIEIGFGSKTNSKEISLSEFIEKAEFPSESLGRFPVFIHLNDLSLESLIEILNYSDESEIKVQKQVFKDLGYDLEITDDFILEIAKKAIKLNTGARSLQKSVYEKTLEAYKYAYDNPNQDMKIVLTKNTVNDPTNFIVKKQSIDQIKKLQLQIT